jgi:death-on-curing protein
MKPPVWVLRDTVVAVQEQLLAAFGGGSGVRDAGLLESTLARPVNRLSYERAAITLFDLAAAYAFGLAKNHPFVDGNKRIAFATAVVFLELNGYRFEAGEAEAVIQTLALAAGELKEHEYAQWLKTNSKRTPRI